MSLPQMLIILSIVNYAVGTSIPWLEQISRQETLSAGCQRINDKSTLNLSTLDHILVDHKHRFLYCYVPKVACTNWKRVLMVLTGRVNTTDVASISASLAHSNGSLPKLTELGPERAAFVLNNYTTFMMVRHPFERLLSAYRNKLEDNQPSAKYFQSIFGRYIIKKYRKHPKPSDLKNGDNVTFREFITYLLDEGVNHDDANEHWRTVHQLCKPCLLNYTFIGKYESFGEDADVVLGMIGAPKLMFPQTRSGRTSEWLRTYYRQLSVEEIEKLYRLYEHDFKLFDYTLENVLGYSFG